MTNMTSKNETNEKNHKNPENQKNQKNQKKNIWIKAFTLTALVFGAGGLSACRGGHHSPEARIDHVSSRIVKKLDFNDQQKSLVKDITDEMKKDFAEEKKYRESLKVEIQKLIEAPELDQVRVKTLIKEKQARMDGRVEKYVGKVADLHRTLTVEQKKEILEKLEKFSERFED